MKAARRMVILAEGKFSPLGSKTANQALRYIPNEVVGVIDSQQAGRTASDVLGFGGGIPVFPDLQNSLKEGPNTLLIGIAPSGGKLPEAWRPVVNQAIESKLNIISGLHTFISDDEQFACNAKTNNVEIIDLRKVSPEYEVVCRGLWKTRNAKTVLTVGTDCNVGKMTASLEFHREFERRGLESDFVATGQTGILLSGKGVAVDSLLSDYVAGAIELEIEKRVRAGKSFIHVEGQGSLTHQGYSAVTLGLIHGVMPDAMIIVHHPVRRVDDYDFPLDNVKRLIALHEMVVGPFKASKVVAVALNTALMTRRQAEIAKREIGEQTGVPVGDVLTSDVKILADALTSYFDVQQKGDERT